MGAGRGSGGRTAAEPGAVLDPSGTIPSNLAHPGLIPQEETQGCYLRPMHHPRVSRDKGCSADSGVALHPQPVPPGPG